MVAWYDHDKFLCKIDSNGFFQTYVQDHVILTGRRPWQYGLWSFQTGYVKLERFLPKNQHNQRELLNFENWISGGPQKFSKIGVLEINYFHPPIHLTNE